MTKELDQEIADLKATIETNQGLYEGKLAAMQEQLDTATNHATNLSTELKTFQDEAEAKRKAIRKDNEAKAHAIQKDLELTDWSDDRLVGYLEGHETAPKAHSTHAPPAGGGTSPVPETAASRLYNR